MDDARRQQVEQAMKAVQAAAEAQGQGAPGQGAGGQGAPQQELPEPLPIDWTTEPTPASANGLQITHQPTEFAMLFTDMAMFPGRNAVDGQTGHERARVVSSLRVHPDVYFQMLCIMASNWNRFVEANVPPQMRQPRFKLLDAGELQLYGIKPPKEDG